MSLFAGPEEHEANPPESWKAAKLGRHWALVTKAGTVLGHFPTKEKAEQGKVDGLFARLYADESRWYAGQTGDSRWKPYAETVKPEDRRVGGGFTWYRQGGSDRWASPRIDRTGKFYVITWVPAEPDPDGWSVSLHQCLVCCTGSDLHPERCHAEGCDQLVHWPALCCPGCPCGSYEQAHGLAVPS